VVNVYWKSEDARQAQGLRTSAGRPRLQGAVSAAEDVLRLGVWKQRASRDQLAVVACPILAAVLHVYRSMKVAEGTENRHIRSPSSHSGSGQLYCMCIKP